MEKLNRIKEVLVSKDMTQKELATKMGKSTNSITSVCNNKSQPHLKDLRKIAEILDVDVRELLVPSK
jgi:transcriptional regulator with XRE-family HTH domain